MNRRSGSVVSKIPLVLLVVASVTGLHPLFARVLFSPLRLDVGFYSSSTATADFNRDGRPDLVAVGYGNAVAVLLGDGQGSFAPPATVPAGSVPVAVGVGDFNRD